MIVDKSIFDFFSSIKKTTGYQLIIGSTSPTSVVKNICKSRSTSTDCLVQLVIQNFNLSFDLKNVCNGIFLFSFIKGEITV